MALRKRSRSAAVIDVVDEDPRSGHVFVFLEHLNRLAPGQQVMLKLTLPSQDDFYRELIDHPHVLRVVALSGGYTRADANARPARNPGMIASFSRALTEGLTAQQSDQDFDRALDESIESIFQASRT